MYQGQIDWIKVKTKAVNHIKQLSWMTRLVVHSCINIVVIYFIILLSIISFFEMKISDPFILFYCHKFHFIGGPRAAFFLDFFRKCSHKAIGANKMRRVYKERTACSDIQHADKASRHPPRNPYGKTC